LIILDKNGKMIKNDYIQDKNQQASKFDKKQNKMLKHGKQYGDI
jgi:hypothetical protein